MKGQVDTVGAWLLDLVQRYPGRCALHADEPVGYDELERRSGLLAAALLEANVGVGAHIGLLAPNGVDWVVGWFAITRIGAVAVPLSTVSSAQELGHMIRFADVRIVLAASFAMKVDLVGRLRDAVGDVGSEAVLKSSELPWLRAVWMFGEAADGTQSIDRLCLSVLAGWIDRVAAAQASVHASFPAVVVFTSGTRAEPKAVVHSHGTVVRQAGALADLRRLLMTDRLLALMPFFWVGGLAYDLLSGLHAGATMVFPSSFDPGSILEVVSERRVTRVSAWPNQTRAFREHPAFAGGDYAHVVEGLVDDGMDVDALGMTETFGPHSGFPLRRSEAWRHAGSFGPALVGMQRRCVDPDTCLELPSGQVGELWLRGPNLMLGYYRRDRAETFTDDGWFRTGDRAVLDRHGDVLFHGRLNGMIKTGGANVSPAEVEDAVRGLDGVLDCAVIGLPHPDLGEIVGAVALVSAERVDSADRMRDALRTKLAGYKIPRVLILREPTDAMMTASGKLKRNVAEALLLEVLKPDRAATS